MSGPWSVLRERQHTDPVAYQAVRAVQYGVDPDEALAVAVRAYIDRARSSNDAMTRLLARVPMPPIAVDLATPEPRFAPYRDAEQEWREEGTS